MFKFFATDSADCIAFVFVGHYFHFKIALNTTVGTLAALHLLHFVLFISNMRKSVYL